MMVKLFSLVSLVIIPFVSIDSGAIGSYVAARLVFNALMAIILSQLVFMIFPLCEADIPFEKKKKEAEKQQRIDWKNQLTQVLDSLALHAQEDPEARK